MTAIVSTFSRNTSTSKHLISEDYCEQSYYQPPTLDLRSPLSRDIWDEKEKDCDVVEYDLGEISSLPGLYTAQLCLLRLLGQFMGHCEHEESVRTYSLSDEVGQLIVASALSCVNTLIKSHHSIAHRPY